MAWQDRHYNQSGFGGSFGGRLQGASVVVWLLGINGVVFLLGMMLSGSSRGSWLTPHAWGHFSVGKGVFGLQVWRFITYQFLHGDFFHLLFNMFGLYFFGPLMEGWWGSRRFLAFYLLCGVGAAGLYVLLAFVPGLLDVSAGTGLVGASGCIFGVLVGCAVLYPHQQVMLMFPPIPMTLRTMAMVFLGLAMLSLLAGSANAGGEAAHLGGAALGWLLIKNPRWLNFADHAAGDWKDQLSQRVAQKKKLARSQENAEVDRILDKVRDQGLASLTKREQKILKRATDRQRHAG